MGEGAGEAPGNPVNLVDPDGRIFTDSLAKYVTILRKDINNKIREYTENNKDFQSKIDELNNALKEIDVLEESTQLYDIQHDAGMPFKGDPEIEYHGWTEYDLESNTLVIKISPSDYDAFILIHELKHAYQFETGYMSFNSDGKTGGIYYDITDEEEAFYRAYALGNKEEVPPSFYYDKLGKNRPSGGVVYPYKGYGIVHQKFRKK